MLDSMADTLGTIYTVLVIANIDSFADCTRPNLGEFDGAKSNVSLNRNSKYIAIKRSHFAKCICFRKRNRHHEGEFFYYSIEGYTRRRGRCVSFSNWSFCKCNMNNDCVFVQNLTLCVCVCRIYKRNRQTRNKWGGGS